MCQLPLIRWDIWHSPPATLFWIEFRSFVHGRSNRPSSVAYIPLRSQFCGTTTGVLQGTYSPRTTPVHSIHCRGTRDQRWSWWYAQAYEHCIKSNDVVRAFTQLQCTLTKFQNWMHVFNRLKLNPSKTQFSWFGTRVQLTKIDEQELIRQFPGVVFHSGVVDLDVIILVSNLQTLSRTLVGSARVRLWGWRFETS